MIGMMRCHEKNLWISVVGVLLFLTIVGSIAMYSVGVQDVDIWVLGPELQGFGKRDTGFRAVVEGGSVLLTSAVYGFRMGIVEMDVSIRMSPAESAAELRKLEGRRADDAR